jgi:LPS O-antigen subunit length determinant protein (WzzB/FepE family)
MNAKRQAYEFVNLVKVYRNGQQESASMLRWVAELEIGCIPLDQPGVARARIEPIQIDRRAAYPIKRASPEQTCYIALYLASFLPAPLVA